MGCGSEIDFNCGWVDNDATIRATHDGYIEFNDGVSNSGLIEARMGTIALASGNRLTLTVGDTGLVDVAVDVAVGVRVGVAVGLGPGV